MRIRLTVLGPRGAHPGPLGRAARAPRPAPRAPEPPAGPVPSPAPQPPATVAVDVLVTAPAGTTLSAVASGLADAVAAAGSEAGGAGAPVFSGADRLDPQRCVLGEPPLVDGAVISLGAPAGPHGWSADPVPEAATGVRLHVVAGPDAGGVHLLHGGQIRIGRSTEADVPLDDPDVSRLHCAVTVADDGRITVADLGSTNGTLMAGRRVGATPVPLAPDTLVRIGESALRLRTPADGEDPAGPPVAPDGEGHLRVAPAAYPGHGATVDHRPPHPGQGPHGGRPGHRAGGTAGTGPGGVPGGSGARPHAGAGPAGGAPVPGAGLPSAHRTALSAGTVSVPLPGDEGAGPEDAGGPAAPPRRRGIGAWARRLAGGRAAEREPGPGEGPAEDREELRARAAAEAAELRRRWPDPADILLTALAPGHRLWERGPEHPDALTVRLGTADRTTAGGAVIEAAPVTVDLRRAGSLGLAGPRARLAGLARSVVAQLAALHSPAALEIVLISTDRNRGAQERLAEWSWLGWLPQLHPAHGQDCRLLLAYDREQAMARAAELTRRLDGSGLGPAWATAPPEAVEAAARAYPGPYAVVVVDGDPGSPALRDSLAALAAGGAAGGVHLICLAETEALPAGAPVAAGHAGACAVSPVFAECGTVALLSGDVATGLRLMRPARPHRPSGDPQGAWTAGAPSPAAGATAAPGEGHPGPWAAGGAAPAPGGAPAPGAVGGSGAGVSPGPAAPAGGAAPGAGLPGGRPDIAGTTGPHDRPDPAGAAGTAAGSGSSAWPAAAPHPGATGQHGHPGATGQHAATGGHGHHGQYATAEHAADGQPDAAGRQAAAGQRNTTGQQTAAGQQGHGPTASEGGFPSHGRTAGASDGTGTPQGHAGAPGPAAATPGPGHRTGEQAGPHAHPAGPGAGPDAGAHPDGLARPGAHGPAGADDRHTATGGDRYPASGRDRYPATDGAPYPVPGVASPAPGHSPAGAGRPARGTDRPGHPDAAGGPAAGHHDTARAAVPDGGGHHASRPTAAAHPPYADPRGHDGHPAGGPGPATPTPGPGAYGADARAYGTGPDGPWPGAPGDPAGGPGHAAHGPGRPPGTAPAGPAYGAGGDRHPPYGTGGGTGHHQPGGPSPDPAAGARGTYPGPGTGFPDPAPAGHAPGPAGGAGRVPPVFTGPAARAGEPAGGVELYEGVATVDAVSAAWAERFARALAPLRPSGAAYGAGAGRGAAALPATARLLDELGLARATPASLLARWAAAADEVPTGGRTLAVLGAGVAGPLSVDLAADGPHLLIDGGPGTGKTELLRSVAASLSAAERPDRLAMVLVDGGGAERGEGLRVCTDLPHVSTYLAASDPVRMREFAQALAAELKRRAELLGRLDFVTWHAQQRDTAPRVIAPRRPGDTRTAPDARPAPDAGGAPRAGAPGTRSVPAALAASGRPSATDPGAGRRPEAGGPPQGSGGDLAGTDGAPPPSGTGHGHGHRGDLETPPSSTLKLRPGRQSGAAADAGRLTARTALPRLVVLVDDFDALVAPALGSPGRPAAGSVVRALEAVARDGARLGVHLVAASGRPDRTAETAAVEHAGLRITLEPPAPTEEPGRPDGTAHGDGGPGHGDGPGRAADHRAGGATVPGRGRLHRPDDAVATPFQAGRVTGRIPRTATQRPTVVPLDWTRMGDPPTRRPVRELGNGPTDLALLASALQRAAQSAQAPTAPALG